MVDKPATAPLVDLVIPCLNEARVLKKSVTTIRGFLHESFPFLVRSVENGCVVIANNSSEDGTSETAEELAGKFDDVFSFSLSERGWGRAMCKVWIRSSADILAYTDVDISTELEVLEELCRAIWEEGYDIAIGSRLMKDSRVTRGLKREFISRGYNLFPKFGAVSPASATLGAASKRCRPEWRAIWCLR